MSDVAATEKALGNTAFSAKDYETAVKHFTLAIAADPSQHVLFSNRSAAYVSMGKYEDALADAEKCVSLNSSWAKGYSRKGAALQYLDRLDEAIAAYKKGLEIDPNNTDILHNLKELEERMSAPPPSAGMNIGAMFSSKPNLDKLMANPTTAAYFSQPDFLMIVNTIKQDPSKLNMYIQDPRVMKCFGVILGIDMQTAGSDDTDMPSSQQHHYKPEPKHASAPPKAKAPAPEPVLSPEEQEKKRRKDEAADIKKKGNDEYRARNFSKAVELYNQALEIDDSDMTILSNLAAVKFEMGQFEESIADCQRSIEVGRAHYCDYSQIGKAYARIGNSYHRLGRHSDAIDAYNKSLTEHRTDDVWQRLKKVQAEQKKAEAEAYISPEKALEEKEKGNEFFKLGKFPEAIKHYSDAIKRDPKNAVYYSNRAAAYQKIMELPLALKDCQAAIELDPKFIKAYLRQAFVHFGMKEYHKAIADYEKVLSLDPENSEAKDGLMRTQVAVTTAARSGERDPQQVQRAMEDPEIRAILTDPIMNNVLQELQEDPVKGSRHLKDPSIAGKLDKLIAAGVIRLG